MAKPEPSGAGGPSPSKSRPVEELVGSSSLIFAGTVIERGASTVPAVSPTDKLVVVRLDRGLRVDPALGDVSGKAITVAATAPESLSPGQRAVFFTNSWIHGRGIAVREVEHVDIREEDNVAAAVNRLPQVHLLERLRGAQLVVDARVTRITQVRQTSGERNAAVWAAANLTIEKVLRGEPERSTVVYFPTSDHPLWARAPRFTAHQRGVFILHAPSRDATLSEATIEPGILVALDPADLQPESQLPEVERLLGTIK